MALIPVGLGVVISISLLVHLVPGDPVDVIAGQFASEEEKVALRTSMGLDRPVPEQIAHYVTGIFQGSLGESLLTRKPVLKMITERFRPTMELAILSLIIAILISLPLGILSAVKAGKPVDYIAMGFALAGIAVPTFWLGPMLVLVFSLELGWFPVSERTDLLSYVLPALTLGTALAAVLSRMTRNSMLDSLKEDFVRTARAKGNAERTVILKHVLRNAALPLVTILGLQFGVLLTGTIITERIFDWPGLGSLILEGISTRDYPVVQGCVLLFSATYLIVNMITDIVYAIVDPRIKING